MTLRKRLKWFTFFMNSGCFWSSFNAPLALAGTTSDQKSKALTLRKRLIVVVVVIGF